ncbi:MAG: DNA methyltransferase [Thaumarchaeota archaeon]|nr:DNA methyltransferase [Candidatus Calditenuaceae archaeon]MDW8187548.1 DNA methyltransferase [Nitrososphaerota archaeon]
MQKEVECVSAWELDGTWKGTRGFGEHSLHSLCSRTGSFPPSLARYFIQRFSKRGSVVLDPFSGKGTAPLEACLLGRIGVGNDLAPEAYVLSRAKVRAVGVEEVQEWVRRNRSFIESYNSSDAPEEVRVFYSRSTLKQVLAVKELLSEPESDVDLFVTAVMLGILHGSSSESLSVRCSHSFSMSPWYVARSARKSGLKKPERNVPDCLLRRTTRVLADGLPQTKGFATNVDARSLPLPSQSIDLIVTSPPYFNMQTYAWDNWLRLWFLGHDYKEVAKRLFHTYSVNKFLRFSEEFLREFWRVLKPSGSCLLVLGVVKLRGEVVNMAEMMLEVVDKVGFTPVRIITDEIPKEKKYLMYLGGDQGVKREVVLELRREDSTAESAQPVDRDEMIAVAR